MYALILLLGMVQDSSSIRGVVRAQTSLDAIARATVSLPALNRTVSTDAQGAFEIARVPSGRWRVDVRALGYEPHTVTVVSAGTAIVQLDFELAIKPLRIGGVLVNPLRATSGSTVSGFDAAGPPPIRLASAQELKYLPGFAEPDVLRSLQVLPAVGAMSDFSSALYVRGGASDQNVVLLDGVQIFNPYHMGGLFSAINADAVAAVDVWTGALPASSADRLASVIHIQPRRGSREQGNVQGNIGLISSQLTLDGPLPGRRGSYLISGRSTYLDVMTDLAYRAKLLDVTVPYGFTDLFARLEHDLDTDGAISWSGYIDGEGVGLPSRMARAADANLDFVWGSRASALTARRRVGKSVLGQLRFGYSDFHGGFDGRTWSMRCTPGCLSFEPGDTTQIVLGHSLTRSLNGELDLTWYGQNHQMRLGAAVSNLRVRHHVNFENTNSEFLKDLDWRQQAGTIALYAEDEWTVSPRLTMRAGGRLLEAGRYGRAWLPRLGARYQLHDGWSLSLGAGRYAQLLRGMRDDESAVSSFLAYELFALQPDSVGLARADDLVLGLQWEAARSSLRVDAYTRRMRDLVLPLASADLLKRPAVIDHEYRLGHGRAHGLELMARHQQGRVGLGLNYAYTVARRRAGLDDYTPRFERRHNLDLTASYTSTTALLSARFALASGQPYTPAVAMLPNWLLNGDGHVEAMGYSFLMGEHNSGRMPGYARLDIAARRTYQKRWFGRETDLTPYLQVINVLNSKNVLLTEPFVDAFRKPVLRYWPQMPIVPTFGVEWKF